MTSDPLPEAATPENITHALRRSGSLGDGRVSEVVVESSRTTILSKIIRLRLTYDREALTSPSTVILKIGHPDRLGDANWDAGRQEVAFYNGVAAVKPGHHLLRCYEAAWDAATRAWHLLLEDLTDTHVIATVWPLPPTVEQCESIICARARFHADWWDEPRLGVSIGTWQDETAMITGLKRFEEKLALFSDRFGDILPPERRQLYRRLIDSGLRLHTHSRSHRNMTIVQGGGRQIFEFETGKPIAVVPSSDSSFYVDGRYHTQIAFTKDASGRVCGAVLNPGPWEQRGMKDD